MVPARSRRAGPAAQQGPAGRPGHPGQRTTGGGPPCGLRGRPERRARTGRLRGGWPSKGRRGKRGGEGRGGEARQRRAGRPGSPAGGSPRSLAPGTGAEGRTGLRPPSPPPQAHGQAPFPFPAAYSCPVRPPGAPAASAGETCVLQGGNRGYSFPQHRDLRRGARLASPRRLRESGV